MPRPHPYLTAAVIVGLTLLCARALAPPEPPARRAMGSGPTVVLVHGLGSSREHWLPVARLLARRHRVEFVDLPGHGELDMPEPFSLERAAAVLDRRLADLPDGPPVLVGHSLGGLVAAAATIARPGRVRGLVLVESALRPQVPPAARRELLARLERDYAGLVRDAYLGFGRDSAQGERLHREVARLDPRMVRRWIRLAWSADLSATAGRLDLPVLAVLSDRSWGATEPWETVADALGYSQAPRLRGVRLDDAGHFVMLDHPAALAALIAGFAADPEASLAVGP